MLKCSFRPSRRSLLAASGAAFAGIGFVRAPGSAAQFELKIASSQPLDYPVTIRGGQMWAEIERDSGGRIHAQFYPNGILGGDPSLISQLRLGAIHFQFVAPGNFASVVPAVDISNIGFVFKDQDDALRVLDGALGTYLRRETAAKGLYGFRQQWASGMFQIGSNSHPIRTPEDLGGFKVRIADSKIFVDLFKDLGATPVQISLVETYTALQTKIVDGMSLALATIEGGKTYEVSKFISLTNHAWSGIWLVANGEVWKSLPADLQDLIERKNTQFTNLERRETKALNSALAAKLTSQGLVLNQVDQTPFRNRLGSYFSSWANTFGPTAWGLLQSSLGRPLA